MIERLYQSVFLKQWDERTGADHSELRMFPPYQSLGAGEDRLIAAYVKFRLIEYGELFLADRRREIIDKLFFKYLRLAH